MEYQPINITPAWSPESITKSREFFRAFLAEIPRRIDHLSSFVDVSWVWATRSPAEECRGALRQLDRFAAGLKIWEFVEPAGHRVQIQVLNPKVAKELREIERRDQAAGAWVFTGIGDSFALDLAILLGEYFRARYAWLRWEIDERKSSLFYGSPYVRHHELVEKYEVHVLNNAGVLMHSARLTSNLLSTEIVKWMENVVPSRPIHRVRERSKPRRRE